MAKCAILDSCFGFKGFKVEDQANLGICMVYLWHSPFLKKIVSWHVFPRNHLNDMKKHYFMKYGIMKVLI